MILFYCTVIPKPYNSQLEPVGILRVLHLRSTKYFYKTGRTLGNEQVVVGMFSHLCCCVSTGVGVSDEIITRTVKARAAYENLGHL